MPATTFKEKAVVEIWQQYLTTRTDLETEDGRPIKVVYPGMINGDRGADLVDAVIHTGRRQVQGSVEIHVNSSGWWGHGHHEDPAYNGVILHVVYWHDREKVIHLQNGNTIPTLVLSKFIKSRFDRNGSAASCPVFQNMPCRDIVHQQSGALLEETLDAAGEERFLTRAAGFKAELNRTGADQTLYAGIMESLGYAKNKNQMKTLAGLLPLSKLEKLIAANAADENCLYRLQGLLLGTAGLLPSQRSGKIRAVKPANLWIEKLETFWASSGEIPKMVVDHWHFFKVRPGNHPTRRLVAMSYLLFRYRKRGILPGLLDSICQDGTCPEYRPLEEALYVPATGYEEDNPGYGRPGRRTTPALLGRGRAADIVINVLLPMAAVRAESESHPGLAHQIQEIYHQYPRLTTNNLEKHMQNQLGITHSRINSARRQQGLIHIYRRLCSRGKCSVCPLNIAQEESSSK